jgi:hypothetical protein
MAQTFRVFFKFYKNKKLNRFYNNSRNFWSRKQYLRMTKFITLTFTQLGYFLFN